MKTSMSITASATRKRADGGSVIVTAATSLLLESGSMVGGTDRLSAAI